MRLFIDSIILWPKNRDLEPRLITFRSDAINVITGRSRSGKSSIAGIVDYCLGSEKCTIPVGEIRKHTAWFGLQLRIGPVQLMLARMEPQRAAASTSFCLREGQDATSLDYPEKLSTLEAVKSLLDRLSGLPNLDFGAGNEAGSFGGRPSFRDMAAFTILPQHVVANPLVLFYKTETTEHREKLRTIFPLVLGAIDVSYLQAEHELNLLEQRIREKTAQLQRREEAARAWEGDAFSLYSRARELSLLPEERRPATLAECLVDRKSVV